MAGTQGKTASPLRFGDRRRSTFQMPSERVARGRGWEVPALGESHGRPPQIRPVKQPASKSSKQPDADMVYTAKECARLALVLPVQDADRFLAGLAKMAGDTPEIAAVRDAFIRLHDATSKLQTEASEK